MKTTYFYHNHALTTNSAEYCYNHLKLGIIRLYYIIYYKSYFNITLHNAPVRAAWMLVVLDHSCLVPQIDTDCQR